MRRHALMAVAVAGAALLTLGQPAGAAVFDLAPSSDVYSTNDHWPGGHDSSSYPNPTWNGAGHYYSYDSCCGTSAGSQSTALTFDTSGILGTVTSAELFVYITSVNPGQPGSSVTVGTSAGNFGNLLTHDLGWYGIDVSPILPVGGSVGFSIAVGADVNNGGVSVQFGAPNSPTAGIGPYLELTTAAVTGGVPEASTWAMMLLGVVGLGLAGYRSRRTVRVG